MSDDQTIHLHRDYHTAFCGLDASHIPMTYERGDSTCASCLAAAAKADETAALANIGEAAQIELDQEEEDERQALEAARIAELEALAAETKAADQEMAKMLDLRAAEIERQHLARLEAVAQIGVEPKASPE